MAEKLTPYDSADYLKTEEDIAAYLEAAVEGNDPALIAHSLGVVARARSMSKLSKEVGISRQGLYEALSAEGNPSFSTVVKVALTLGFRFDLVRANASSRKVSYRKAAKPIIEVAAKPAASKVRKTRRASAARI